MRPPVPSCELQGFASLHAMKSHGKKNHVTVLSTFQVMINYKGFKVQGTVSMERHVGVGWYLSEVHVWFRRLVMLIADCTAGIDDEPEK
jgi:hypothetical protein